jgi:hypothetical protein
MAILFLHLTGFFNYILQFLFLQRKIIIMRESYILDSQ